MCVICYCLVAKSSATLVTPGTVALQAPLSIGFPRQEYWSGLPFPSPGDLPNPGIKPVSLHWQEDSSTTEPPGKPYACAYVYVFVCVYITDPLFCMEEINTTL